jgi:hypothetical protein
MRTRDHGKPHRLLAEASFFLAAFASVGVAHAQGKDVPAGSIYTCTDAQGRTLTADRPIPACNDREQRELSPSGLTRRKIEPTYSAREMAEREDRAREAAVQAAKATDERRRNRALLMRYQDQASHDRERADALSQVDEVIVAANKRLAELDKQNDAIKAELEFYKNDATKAPAKLRRQIARGHDESVRAQQRFIADQAVEKKRVNDRFDEELARLKPLWNGPAK